MAEKVKFGLINYKKIIKIIGNIIVFCVMVLAIFLLFITVTAKKDSDGASNIFGYQIRFIKSDSMEKNEFTNVSKYEIKDIKTKSLVFIKLKPQNTDELAEWYSNLKIGDVLTFKYLYTKQETITHRIVDIKDNNKGGYLIYLEGDNKGSSNTITLKQIIDTSAENSPNFIIGKVTKTSYFLGNLYYIFRSPIGIICLIIIPCLTIIIFHIIKIINLFTKEKRKKSLEALEELNELKKRLIELEQKN